MNIQLTNEINAFLLNSQDFPNFHIFDLQTRNTKSAEFGSLLLLTSDNDLTLLRSLQLALYIETQEFININDLVSELHKFLIRYIEDNKIGAYTNSNEDIYKNVYYSEHVQPNNQTLLTVNSFNFFKYLSDITPKIDQYRNGVLNLMPQILAQFFQCSISIYQAEKDKPVFLTERNNVDYRKNKIRLNILMVEEHNACMIMVKTGAKINMHLNDFLKHGDNMLRLKSNSRIGKIYAEFKWSMIYYITNNMIFMFF